MSSESEIKALRAENERLLSELENKEARIASLEYQLQWLRRKLFGKMSEKGLPGSPADLGEPTLFDDEMSEEDKAALETEMRKTEESERKTIEVKSHERKVRKAAGTPDLEVREEHVWPEVENRDDYTELAPEVTDTLELVPAQMYIRRIIRHKLVLKSSLQIADPDRRPFELPPLPPVALEKSMAGASLLTDIIIEKFFYHMPFYRVMQKYKELGVIVSSSTMNDWYAATCEKLKLLYDMLRREVLAQDYLQVDESTVPVVDNEKHRAVKGYMWCMRAVQQNLVVFHYDMGSRSHETARKLLTGYHGYIQTDGYGAYDQFEQDPHIEVLGCWAHARRKFCDALEEDRQRASEALTYINKLYGIEQDAEDAGISGEALKEKRQKESYPIMQALERWMSDTAMKVGKNSRIGRAIAYTYPLMPRLARYVKDGRFRIDNNLVENAIRPLALGRKNYLFCGNHDAAIRAAVVYSLVGTCKMQDIDAREWMSDVLPKISLYTSEKRDLSELLPHRWAEARADKQSK